MKSIIVETNGQAHRIGKAILMLGWEIQTDYSHAMDRRIYRATQGGFKTLWRDAPEQVLADVQKLQEARQKPSPCPF